MYGSYGGGYANSATGFGTNVGYATSGSDTAYLYDSPQSDTFYAYADFGNTGKPSAGMFGGYDGGYPESASGFSTNLGYATSDGSDNAYFYDSPGNDTFYAYGDYNSGKTSAGMFGSFGGGYANEATGFAMNVGISTEGGSDTAYFYDSPGNDTFYSYANYNSSGKTSAGMYGSYGGAYANSASGFAVNIGNSTEGGNDTAYLFGLSGKNALYTDLAIAELYGSSYGEQASGFGLVNASAPASGVNTPLEGPGPLDYELNLIGIWA